MSYILDALRRAEAERERGSVPGLHAQAAGRVAATPEGSAGSAPRWALPAVAVLALAVALLAWRPWAVESATPVAGTGGVVGPVGHDPAPASPTPLTVGTAPAAPPPLPSTPTRTVEAPVRRAAAPVPLTTAAKKRTVAATSGAVAEVPGPASAAAVEPKVYSLAELPPDIRQQLPQIAVGGSIYSASPASRFVIVNGQLFHEGDTLAPGVVLEQIRLKSAVLSFRGYRYGIAF